jgi:NADH dehydrogenase
MPLSDQPGQGRPRVVIVGAGFAGLWAVRELGRGPAADVVLIDRQNYHTFAPLLYQVATAMLEPEEIAYPVRSIVRRLPRAGFLMTDIRGIDLEARRVIGDAVMLPYDYLILGTGSVPYFFDVPGAREHAFPLKSLEDAVRLRNHVLWCFERAEREVDAARRRRLLTFAVIGGGPTGVEFAGALAELLHGPVIRDYPAMDAREVRVVLLEAEDHLLPGLPKSLGAYALARLRGMGIDARLRAQVTRVTAGEVQARGAEPIPTETVVWTAGVRGDPAAGSWNLAIGGQGRVTVLPTLQTRDHAEVYVVGDLAYLEDGGRPLPMVAPVAIQQARWAASNIRRQIAGKPPLPFRYKDPGMLATVGRNAAVADIWGRQMTGFPAWVLWLGVHLANLIGFRNRMLVLVNWAWDYLFYERAVRLILPRPSGPR